MAIRMSGLQSGLDTETLVSALVSGYTLQKDKLVKAQTKLSWKQDAWKSMNTSIYSFYSGKLSSARMSASYNLKTSSVSDSTKAKVTASSSAVNGTQTLEITKLASTGYLTGGVVSTTSGGKVSGSTKLSDMMSTASAGGKISVTVDGTTKDIELTDDMTVNNLVTSLKSAGLNASFDETNQRFFISSKTSGAEHDFSLTGSDSNGIKTLKDLGLFTSNATDLAQYKKLAAMTDSDVDAMKQEAYEEKKISYADRAQTYADKYNAAQKTLEEIKANDTFVAGDTADTLKARAESAKTKLETDYAAYAKKNDAGDVEKDDDGNIVYDTDKLKEDGKLDEYNTAKTAADNLQTQATKFAQAEKDIADTENLVTLDADGKATVDTEDENNINAAVRAEVDAENATIQSESDAAVQAKIDYARSVIDSNGNVIAGSDLDDSTTYADGKGPARVVGSDAEIMLNGAKYVNNTNSFSVNGLTIEATALTDANSPITVTTNTDVDGIYNNIKEFLKEYNTLITAMDTAYNADSAKGYDPLTSDEKDAMSDDEVEKWETKIKDSLLRKDSTLGNASSSMKNIMATSFTINGKSYALSSFGIATQGYFASGTNEKGVLHIDGDSDDSVSAGNDDKLRAMIASDPDVVVNFFSQLSTKLYTDLGNRMAATSTSSAFTIYNDKQMTTEYSNYTTKISDAEDKISTWEDYYYSKFSSMESALATLNQTQSSLSGYFS